MIIRSLLLLLPLSLWVWLFINRHLSLRDITASFLGFVWVFNVSLFVNVILLHYQVWTIDIKDTLFYGVPLDWLLSQAIICGALIPLARLFNWNLLTRAGLSLVTFVLVYQSIGINLSVPASISAIIMLTVLVPLPAILLSDWTAQTTRVYGRSLLQSLAWMIFLYWFFPSAIFQLTSESWNSLLTRDPWTTLMYAIPLALPAILVISALYQFAKEGNGTAFPYDPPLQLVTGGVYRYISNPMQTGICLSMAAWGVIINSQWVALSALIAFILFLVFRDVCNGSCAIGKNNPDWLIYQKSVPKWIPRFKTAR